ncbi:hypothetical protein CES85_4589 [Ochrobactrum quorumnocens]|uniref:Uncharacterized protein n=1 Tax=Ochrobactrum quorumnocens TaxID=271865 RepID=A0A248UAW3_9HYPH|nr:hypothetical protein CES85_4589 [[Ochrobactrum] quorumnocens]
MQAFDVTNFVGVFYSNRRHGRRFVETFAKVRNSEMES